MTATLTMFDMVLQRDALTAIVAEQDGELTPDQEAAWNALDGDFAQKVENTALVICERQATADAIKAEAGKLIDRARAVENDAKRLRDLLASRMTAFGKDKVTGTLKTVAFQKNPPSVQPVVAIDEADLRNLAMIAPGFVRHEETWALDKKAVIEAHKAGALPDDIAKRVQIVQTQSLRIK